MGTNHDKRQALVARFGHAHVLMSLYYLKPRGQVDPQRAVLGLDDTLQEMKRRIKCFSELGLVEEPDGYSVRKIEMESRPSIDCGMAFVASRIPKNISRIKPEEYGLLRIWQDLDQTDALMAHLAALDKQLRF